MSKLTKGIIALVAVLVVGMILRSTGGGIFREVKAEEYQIKQALITGTITSHMEPGWYTLWWGHVYDFPKREIFSSIADMDEGAARDESIHVRFIDGSDAAVSATAMVMLPSDPQLAANLVTEYGFTSWESLRSGLILPNLRRILVISAGTMNATQSYQNRPAFLRLVQDQVENGLYDTFEEQFTYINPMTGTEETRTRTVIRTETIELEDGSTIEQPIRTDLQLDPNTGAMVPRWEAMGIMITQFDLKNLIYNERVYTQIEAQQEALIGIEIAAAEAQEAEQRARTAEAVGQANVTTAQYEQEEIRIRAVVAAEQARDVAELDLQAAEYERQANIERGEGEATRRELVMAADGALEMKLDALVQIHSIWANSFGNYSGDVIPDVVVGSDGPTGGYNGFEMAMEAIGIQAIRELSLDMDVARE
jgi:regulator of protease activity HflC (stomatin/prohibitin superfamily)